MNRPSITRTLAALIAVATLAALAAGALAFWSGTGAGGAQARVADPLPLALSPGTPQALLIPGGNVSVSTIATNPNPYVAHVASLELDTSAGSNGFGVDAGHGGCAPSSLHVAAQDNGDAGWDVPPKAGAADGALPIDMEGALSMDAGAADACQGAAFTVHLVAGA